jgi:pimeloyl-ACP methyl ester carboxylesterase
MMAGLVDFPKRRTPWWSGSGTTLAADGTPLAFAWGGPRNASRALVCSNGVGVSTFFWDYVGEYFSRDHKVVIWDYRGHGASGRPTANLQTITIANIADDLARVLDANGIDRAVLLGHSMGCQVILEFYRLFKDRVLGLVPMLGAAGHPADTFFDMDPKVARVVYHTVLSVGRKIPDALNLITRASLHSPAAWPLVRLAGLVHPDLAKRSDMEPYLEHLAQLDLRVFFEMARAAQEHDAGPFLGEIKVPTLVVAGERDLFTPRHLSVEMASRIPNAELLEIPRGSHAALIEQPELINLRLEKLIRERVAPFEAGLLRERTRLLA